MVVDSWQQTVSLPKAIPLFPGETNTDPIKGFDKQQFQ